MKRFALLILAALSVLAYSCRKDGDDALTPVFRVEIAESETFTFGESRSFPVSRSNIAGIDVLSPEGWMVVVGENSVEVTAPARDISGAQYSGTLKLTAKPRDPGRDDITVASEVTVADPVRVITFEDVDSKYLAGPSSYGENLYAGYASAAPLKYEGYLDEVSGLFFHTTTDGNGFASGGIAISRWNDKSTAGYLNQCSVYSGDDGQGNGGNNGSAAFAVSFVSTREGSGAYMAFQEAGKECLIDHAYFTNNTYAVLSMTNGDGFAHAHTYDNRDWFKLTIIGEDKDGVKTGEAECYLSDFRRTSSPGILKQWTKVDLTPLGKVHKVRFEMSSTDGDGYWMNTPAYFCMDDIAIVLE